MAAERSSIPHETAAMRALALATSAMFRSPSGVSVAISRSAVEPNATPCLSSSRSRIEAMARMAAALRGDVAAEGRLAKAGRQGVHADPPLPPAEVQRLEPAEHDPPGLGLLFHGDRVLQVQDQRVGRAREGLGDHLLVPARDEVERAPGATHAGGPGTRRRIMAARPARMTISPRWFSDRCSQITI